VKPPRELISLALRPIRSHASPSRGAGEVNTSTSGALSCVQALRALTRGGKRTLVSAKYPLNSAFFDTGRVAPLPTPSAALPITHPAKASAVRRAAPTDDCS
jgi:hypothetical protein